MNKKKHVTRGHYLRDYLACCAIYVASLILLGLLGILICNVRTWYLNTRLEAMIYWALQWVKYNYVSFFVQMFIIGILAIGAAFAVRIQRHMRLLIDATARLAREKDIDSIELPEALSDVGDRLNLIRQETLHNAAAAKDAEQRKNDLIVYLAHDLKTPLTSTIGYLTLLTDEPDLSPALRSRYTTIALEKALRLEDLINEFFEITRFNLSHLTLEVGTIDLSRMLEQITNEFEPMLQERDLTYELDLPGQLMVECDIDKLARVFDNLLRNCCFYSYPASRIRIHMHASEDTVYLVFQNSGKTIPAEKRARLFDQFFRLDSSRSTREGGSGLGLAIAKQIVELHHGTINLQSHDEQIWFTVTLPLKQEE